jgi:hypothetical protein
MEEMEHEFGKCSYKYMEEWKEIKEEVIKVKEEIQGKRRLERFSGCFNCGFPQEWCDSWEGSNEDGGSFKRRVGGDCQYGSLLFEGIIAMEIIYEGEVEKIIGKVIEEEGLDMDNKEELLEWMGKRIKWGGLESNNLCRLFFKYIEELC